MGLRFCFHISVRDGLMNDGVDFGHSTLQAITLCACPSQTHSGVVLTFHSWPAGFV